MTLHGDTLKREQRQRENLRRRLYIAAIAVFALIWMTPAIWTVVTSFRPEPALQRNLASLIPYPFTTENWTFILKSSQLWKWLGNSAFVSTTHTLAQLTVCTLAAYAFARLDFYFKRVLYILVLTGLMVPFEATFLPVYLLFSNLKLHKHADRSHFARHRLLLCRLSVDAVLPRHSAGIGGSGDDGRRRAFSHLSNDHHSPLDAGDHGARHLHLPGQLEQLFVAHRLRHEQ